MPWAESASFFGLTFTGSSMWSFGIALATVIVALSSPVLGVMADRAAIQKDAAGGFIRRPGPGSPC